MFNYSRKRSSLLILGSVIMLGFVVPHECSHDDLEVSRRNKINNIIQNNIVHVRDGVVKPPKRVNLSNLGGIRIYKGQGATKIGSSITDDYIVKSNANAEMASFYTEYEYYHLGNSDIPGVSRIMVAYRTTMNPYDSVTYKNGLFDWFKETGDASCEYMQTSIDLNSISGALYYSSKPDSSTYEYETTITTTLQPVTSPEGYTYLVPVVSTSETTKYTTVMVENNSSRSKNIADIKYKYMKVDGYSMSTNSQIGCIIFNVPISSGTTILFRLKTQAEFSIAKNGFWGASLNSGSLIHNAYVTV